MSNSFKHFLEAQGKSKSTIKYTNYYVLDFLSWLDRDNTEAENATGKEVMGYLHYLQKKGLSEQTRSIRLGALHHFFDYQIEQDLRSEHPSRHLKIRGSNKIKITPVLTREDLEKMILDYQIPPADDPRAIKNWFSSYRLSKQRNRTILSLLIYQGLTTAEIKKLEMKDLRLREGEIYVKGSRKSAERTLTLRSNQIMDLMEYHYQVRPEIAKYHSKEVARLFLSTPIAGRTTVTSNTLDIFKKLKEELQEQLPQLENLRHIRTSVITHWLKQYNLREVQYMAGHKNIKSTERYQWNQTEDLLQDIDQFHPLG